MNDFATYLASIESDLSRERGPFVLFALMQREDVPDRWDLVLAAPWIGDNKQALVDDVVARISAKGGPKELVNLSRIVVADPNEPAVIAFNRAFRTEHNQIDVRDSVLFGLPIKHAIVITSRRPEPAAAR